MRISSAFVSSIARKLSTRSVLSGLVLFVVSSVAGSSALGEEQTVGLLHRDDRASSGYTLFAPMASTTTYLIDSEGRVVHFWESQYLPGLAAYLREDGHLLRACADPDAVFSGPGRGGRVQEIDWDGSVLWDFEYSDDDACSHHDVEPLPNGNVLLVAWESKSRDEALARGRSASLLEDGVVWPDHIVEVRPTGPTTGSVVWEWHVWDHLIQDSAPARSGYGTVADYPELVDVNFDARREGARGFASWTHVNSVDYNPILDQILISVLGTGEIWIIDHGTTAEEASGHGGGRHGHGGDLLYRWGNPQAYRAGGAGNRRLFGQHDAQWIEPGCPGEGAILVFNNGSGRPDGRYSTVEVIEPPRRAGGGYGRPPDAPYGPEQSAWIYRATPPGSFFSSHISGAQRLSNGNTLICEGRRGRFFEVTLEGDVVWEYVNPVTRSGRLEQGDSPEDNPVFKARRYAPDFPGLAGRDLRPGAPLERYSVAFRRGDCNNDGVIDIADSVASLFYQFPGTFQPPCLDACDFDDSGTIDVTDAIAGLTHQFLGGPPPAAPGNDGCGVDPPEDEVGCGSFGACEDR